MLRLAIRARREKMRPNATGIVGLTGKAVTEIGFEGTILVRGELWPARSPEKIAPCETVRVTGTNGFALDVDRASQTTSEIEWL